MKKILAILLVLVLCASLFAGCECKHEWKFTDCTSPKECAKCGEKEGEAPGHQWKEATTEAPKTCTVCNATEGERIITDERFTTASASPLFGTWSGSISSADMGMGDMLGDLEVDVTMTFNNDGTSKIKVSFDKKEFEQFLIDSLYAEFDSQNMDKNAANDAMKQQFGMTVEEYAASMVKEMDTTTVEEEVYYVEGDKVYTASDWEEDMEESAFSIDKDTLTLTETEQEISMTLTRVTE